MPYDILAVEADQMYPGDIAGPIGAGDHIFIMKLLEKNPDRLTPFAEVQNQLRNRIRLDRRRQAFDKFSERLMRQISVDRMDSFV